MPPKCTTGRQFPAIQSKGCTLDGMTKVEAKAAPAQAPVSDVQRLRNKTYQVALQIKAKRKALEQAERVEKAKEDIVKRIERETVRVYKNVMETRKVVNNKNMRVTDTQM